MDASRTGGHPALGWVAIQGRMLRRYGRLRMRPLR